MTHIRKERGFGAIDFRQRFRPLAFCLVGARIGQAGGNLPGKKIDKIAISRVVAAIRIDPNNQETSRLLLPLLPD